MITPENIATALGQQPPVAGSVSSDQWQMWIDDAYMLIEVRREDLGVVTDQQKVDYVVREAVVAQVRKPDDATQVSVQVDDGMTTRSYKSSTGRVTILDEWWTLLGLNARKGKAFEVDTMPAGAGVVQDPDAMWYPLGSI